MVGEGTLPPSGGQVYFSSVVLVLLLEVADRVVILSFNDFLSEHPQNHYGNIALSILLFCHYDNYSPYHSCYFHHFDLKSDCSSSSSPIDSVSYLISSMVDQG